MILFEEKVKVHKNIKQGFVDYCGNDTIVEKGNVKRKNGRITLKALDAFHKGVKK